MKAIRAKKLPIISPVSPSGNGKAILANSPRSPRIAKIACMSGDLISKRFDIFCHEFSPQSPGSEVPTD